MLAIALTPVPDLEVITTRKISQSTKLFDRTGEIVLYDLNPNERRTSVSLNEISPYLIQATIAVEDASFYEHGGVRPLSVIRALLVNTFTGSFSQGGSTITQQTVKLTLLTGRKDISRKIHEWILAIKLEQRYSKDQILELYLNNTPYGGTLYGIESASRAFFGKSAQDLTLPEAAHLASLPQSPTFLSPYGNNREALTDRKNFVLSRMYDTGKITGEEFESAKNTEVSFRQPSSSSIIAPHFVFFVREYLEKKYGPALLEQGLLITTTLDATLQQEAERIVNEYALLNEKNFNASNAGMVALDPKTGQILAMVGSRDYFDKAIDGNFNITVANRQPGSAFKPFVYAAALEKGFTRDTAIFDLPTQFSTACAPTDTRNNEPPCYAPSNYDDAFRGPMTFTTALAQSINVPAVKVLYLAGIQNVIDLANRFSLPTGGIGEYGLSLALGASEVRLLDLVSAYGAFGAEGVLHPPVSILTVTDLEGNVLEEYREQSQVVIDAGVARDISAMLSSNEARFPQYASVNPFAIPGYDVAAKTGTTNEYRDVWTIGYTPTIAIGVWAGNNDNTPMERRTAGFIAAPMWRAVMDVALPLYPKEFFGAPRVTPENAPAVLFGSYQQNTSSGLAIHDILHWVNKDDPLGGGSSINDPQYPYWEYPVQVWRGFQTNFSGQ